MIKKYYKKIKRLAIPATSLSIILPFLLNVSTFTVGAETILTINTDNKQPATVNERESSGIQNPDSGIFILNSDASLMKYSTAHETFNKIMGGKCKELDLGGKWIANNKIEKIVSDKEHKIIYCIGSKAFRLAQKYGKDKNIIFSLAINWQRFKPGKNTYGISNELNPAMKLMMYKYIFPEIKNIGIIYSKKYSK